MIVKETSSLAYAKCSVVLLYEKLGVNDLSFLNRNMVLVLMFGMP